MKRIVLMHRWRRASRDEAGAALILVIVVMIVIGLMSAGLMAGVTSGLQDRAVLDGVRNREYAADGAIELAVTKVRQLAAPGAALATCGPSNRYQQSLDGVAIRVDCSNVPVLTRTGLLERDVSFSACVDVGVACTDVATVIRAQVNFETASSTSATIVHTYVQSWSVNQ